MEWLTIFLITNLIILFILVVGNCIGVCWYKLEKWYERRYKRNRQEAWL